MNVCVRDRLALCPFAALTGAVFAFLLTAGPALAGPIPANLGAGLYDLVTSRMGPARVQQQLVAEEMLTNSNDDMLRDGADRVLVDIVVDGRSGYDAVRAAVGSVPGVAITAEDSKYRAGIIEGLVPVEALAVLAMTPGVSAIHAVAQAVDDVTAIGVSYFSSAGNTAPTQGYASDLRIVPVAGATAGTNIVLTAVPANLYAGGFHNFASDGGLDSAQTVTLGTGRQLRLTMQWDDPYDVTPVTLGPAILATPGFLSAAHRTDDHTFTGAAGKGYQVDVQGISNGLDPGGSLDVIVAIIQPHGTTLSTIDTGTNENFGRWQYRPPHFSQDFPFLGSGLPRVLHSPPALEDVP